MLPSPLHQVQVDAFTPVAFGGNPAAVVLLPRSALPLPDAVRQQIAAEKNLSETAFLECVDEHDDFARCSRFRLRWFTPLCEVPLCGHATLASAAAIFFGEGNPAGRLVFDTLSGELVVTRQGAAAGAAAGGEADLLAMDLPLVPATSEDVPADMVPGSALVQVGWRQAALCSSLHVSPAPAPQPLLPLSSATILPNAGPRLLP